MNGVNKAIILGTLGADPEVRVMDGGNRVANISVATNRAYKNKSGEKIDETEWHRVVFWGKLAEIVEKYVKKGSKIYIEGRIVTRKWDDKENVTRYTTEIVANEMTMVGRNTSQPSQDDSPSNDVIPDTEPDDLPF